MFFIISFGIIAPFLSSVTLLGTPELFIVLFSNRPLMLSVPSHYMTIFSCFLIIGSIYGIVKISKWKRLQAKRFQITKGKIQALFSVFILSMTLLHSYTWLDLLKIKKTKGYSLVVKKALAFVPAKAFISVPREVAPFVSSREKYNIIDEGAGGYGEYVLTTDNQIDDYIKIFDSPEISLFRRISR
ncbi:MAG: DUF2079 domain-containing protein [Candidatus Omnitrophica bacterium]|nr:DUF2079 domain-containing protein [Candidatus Omnitrophota bacterium]